MPIDREALVRRHDVRLSAVDPMNPLSVGNGDFAVSVDVTGLQTLRGVYDQWTAEAEGRVAVTTATMSTWGWHEMPNPEGYREEDAFAWQESPRGRVLYADRLDVPTMRAAAAGAPIPPSSRAALWLHENPQRADLGRIGFVLGDGALAIPLAASDLSQIEQTLNMWEGAISSSFEVGGIPVAVTTVAHPIDHALAVRVQSDALREGLGIRLAFPYPSDHFWRTSDWELPGRHTSAATTRADGGLTILRNVDDLDYAVSVQWDGAIIDIAVDETGHEITLHAESAEVEFVVRFSPGTTPEAPLPSMPQVVSAARDFWHGYWMSGAALELSSEDDPRAVELERRVVLSQYLTAVHCSGAQPPQETGLVTNSWQGKFHLEMHWWHAAHFALWGRPELLTRSFEWYRRIVPAARDLARMQGYRGLRWPKQVGPEGRNSPGDIAPYLIWQQPHFIHMAELAYRAGARTVLDEYADLVEESAEFMSSFVEVRDGVAHLMPPIMPAQESYDPAAVEDPTYELAYWWWGLEVAQVWRERRGLRRSADWSAVQESLALPEEKDGLYRAYRAQERKVRRDHPSMLMALGFVPPTPVVEPDVMRATLHNVLADWDWASTWGWDFAVMAMTATRLGDADLATDCLMRDAIKNQYGTSGHTPQIGNTLPIYLPSNGSLLAAVALMATVAESSGRGFPASWTVLLEGFDQ